jgi:hypothetical protein
MWRAHHYAFQHSLPAHQRFFPTLKGRKKLHGYEETNEISKGTHSDWMLQCAKKRQTLRLSQAAKSAARILTVPSRDFPLSSKDV